MPKRTGAAACTFRPEAASRKTTGSAPARIGSSHRPELGLLRNAREHGGFSRLRDLAREAVRPFGPNREALVTPQH